MNRQPNETQAPDTRCQTIGVAAGCLHVKFLTFARPMTARKLEDAQTMKRTWTNASAIMLISHDYGKVLPTPSAVHE